MGCVSYIAGLYCHVRWGSGGLYVGHILKDIMNEVKMKKKHYIDDWVMFCIWSISSAVISGVLLGLSVGYTLKWLVN